MAEIRENNNFLSLYWNSVKFLSLKNQEFKNNKNEVEYQN